MKEKLSNIGVIAGAFLASLCCIGPIVFATLGIGGAGLIVGFEAYRPYLIGFTALSLGLAFFFTYRKREVACEDGKCEMRSGSKRNKFVLWSITAFAVLAISYPYVGLGAGEEFDFSSVDANLTTVTIPVEGMTCEGCNIAIQSAVGKLDGVEGVKADYTNGEAKVAYDANKVTTTEITNSINDLGYRVTIPEAQ